VTIDHLFVIWSAPSDGGRHIVGHLVRQRVGSTFHFPLFAHLGDASSNYLQDA
jgi:hypothetical protein